MSTLNVGAIDYTTGVAVRSQAVNTQSGTTYTFVAGDAGVLVSANNASPVTFTIPPQSSVSWGDNAVLKVVNYGAGALTVDGGSGVTVTNTAATLAQFQSAAAIRTGSDAWTLVPFAGGGVGNADFSNAATGTYTDSGVSYKYITFTASGTLTVTQEGLADVLVVAGGGGSGFGDNGGSGGAGGLISTTYYFETGTYNVTIGAGGAAPGGTGPGSGGSASFLSVLRVLGGGGGAGTGQLNGSNGGSGGGGGYNGISTGSGGIAIADFDGKVHGNNGGAGGSGTGGGATSAGAAWGGTPGAGASLAITGTSVEYARGGYNTNLNGPANTGWGGDSGSARRSGGSGVVVVRVKV